MLRKLFGKNKKNKLDESLVIQDDLSIKNKVSELDVVSKNIIETKKEEFLVESNEDKFLDVSPIEDFKYVIAYNKVKIVKYLGNDLIVKVPNKIQGIPVKIIGSEAFEFNKTIEEIYLPTYTQSIESNAFKNCINLKKVNLNNELEEIGKYAFCDSGIISIEIPEKVKVIYESAFRNCANLINIKLNDSLKTIEYGAFNSSSIKEVILPPNIRKIEDFTFGNCTNLTKITLNHGLESIGYGAFNRCKVESLKIPKTVRSIGEMSFSDCNELQSLEIDSNLDSLGKAAFKGCNKLSSGIYEFLVNKYGYINEKKDYSFTCESNSSYTSKCEYEDPENYTDRMNYYEYIIDHE